MQGIHVGKEVVTMEEYKVIKRVAMNEVKDIITESLEFISTARRQLQQVEALIWTQNDTLATLEQSLKEKRGLAWKREIKKGIKAIEEMRELRIKQAISLNKSISNVEKNLYKIGLNVDENLADWEYKQMEKALDIVTPKQD